MFLSASKQQQARGGFLPPQEVNVPSSWNLNRQATSPVHSVASSAYAGSQGSIASHPSTPHAHQYAFASQQATAAPPDHLGSSNVGFQSVSYHGNSTVPFFVDKDDSFILSNRLAQSAEYLRGLGERLRSSSSGIQRSSETVEMLAAKFEDLGGELALECALQQVKRGDNKKRGKLSQAQTFLQISVPIISNLDPELKGRQGVLHEILNSGCIDASESKEVDKMINRARIMQMKTKRTQEKCALTLSFLPKILNSQSIALSYVPELIRSCPLSCEATHRITAAVLLHYFSMPM